MDEVSHKEIYERLLTVEIKVDKMSKDTEGLVSAFHAAEGAFAVLELLAKVAKPLLWLMGLFAAIAAIIHNNPK
jgi:hypothetical protein